jgi:FlaA1/EpsC-like NDP-sugar epimerase
VAVYATLIALAYLASFALRFEFALPPKYVQQFLVTLPLLLAVRLTEFWRNGLFRSYWRHTGVRDLIGIVVSVTVSSLVFVMLLFFARLVDGMPRSVLIIDWVLTIFFCGGAQFATRYFWEARPRFRPPEGRRTLLIGAGSGAELVLRQTHHDDTNDLFIVGLVDDDPSTENRSLHGVPVLGTTEEIARLAQRYHVELLVIAVQHATQEQMRVLVDRCAATGVQYKILPSLTEMLTGPALGGKLRDVRIEDLLGRQPVSLDLAPVAREIAGRCILITGAAGSIGSELARQLAPFRPSRLILFERAETPLYFINLEITRAYPGIDTVAAIGDVTDADRVEQIFSQFRPDYVFHAAAYKHVPLLEDNVREAVRNNVVGTRYVVANAIQHNVRKFVLISTDKAVNPSSVMGATKRVAERILLSASSGAHVTTEFRVVRFGNVLGSDGSVIPLFQRQMAAGQPLTVTHPHVRRYFMTIPEAVQLVLQATVLPEAAGRISMLEMGEPVRILYLAEQMIRLSGLTPYKDVQILFTGLRPGEKLDEELMSEVEATIPTVVEKIRLVNADHVDAEALSVGLNRIDAVLAGAPDLEVRAAIRALVPEYSEFIPRSPLTDLEVPLGGVRRGTGEHRAPVAVPKPALGSAAGLIEPGVVSPSDVARAS